MIACAPHSCKLPQQDNGLCTWRKSKYTIQDLQVILKNKENSIAN